MNLDVFLAFSDIRVRFTQVAGRRFPDVHSMLHCGGQFALPCGAIRGLDPLHGASRETYVSVSFNADRV